MKGTDNIKNPPGFNIEYMLSKEINEWREMKNRIRRHNNKTWNLSNLYIIYEITLADDSIVYITILFFLILIIF